MKFYAKANANIALIKYMGKKLSKNSGDCDFNCLNVPMNVSLSYILDKFYTEVELEIIEKNNNDMDIFENIYNFDLESVTKYKNHLMRIKNIFGFYGNFRIFSKNNFPHSVGIASSASSYAALTKCAIDAITDIMSLQKIDKNEMAQISMMGSGSSCRSFFEPWCRWDETLVSAVEITKYKKLNHNLIVVSESKKHVSSSNAHEIVKTSLLMFDRPNRANKRYENLLCAFEQWNWHEAYQICWAEFMDMHALFETSNPSFGYMNTSTVLALNVLRNLWNELRDGPIITIDAGPNIHLLWNTSQEELSRIYFRELIAKMNGSCAIF